MYNTMYAIQIVTHAYTHLLMQYELYKNNPPPLSLGCINNNSTPLELILIYTQIQLFFMKTAFL